MSDHLFLRHIQGLDVNGITSHNLLFALSRGVGDVGAEIYPPATHYEAISPWRNPRQVGA